MEWKKTPILTTVISTALEVEVRNQINLFKIIWKFCFWSAVSDYWLSSNNILQWRDQRGNCFFCIYKKRIWFSRKKRNSIGYWSDWCFPQNFETGSVFLQISTLEAFSCTTNYLLNKNFKLSFWCKLIHFIRIFQNYSIDRVSEVLNKVTKNISDFQKSFYDENLPGFDLHDPVLNMIQLLASR